MVLQRSAAAQVCCSLIVIAHLRIPRDEVLVMLSNGSRQAILSAFSLVLEVSDAVMASISSSLWNWGAR